MSAEGRALLTAPSTGSTTVLPPKQEQAVINTENKMLRPPHDKIHVSFPGFSRLKLHIFFLKTQCSLCIENLLQRIKQRQTRSNYTGHLNTPLHSLQKEGSSAQLGVAPGKKIYIVQAGYVVLNVFQRGLCCLAASMY